MAKQIKLSDLSPEDLEALKKQALEEELQKEAGIQERRKTYKAMVNETVLESFPLLKEISQKLSIAKQQIINNFQALLDSKKELYNIDGKQTSHSFTTTDGNLTIIIGNHQIDGYDDTVHEGIAKVEAYLNSLAQKGTNKTLVSSVMKLLSKDAKGNLKPSRVLELKQTADDDGNPDFIDGVKIIQDAYKKRQSKQFVRAVFKNEKGEQFTLPLSMTEADAVEQT
jgi:Protein of unknown function (DUF3164)